MSKQTVEKIVETYLTASTAQVGDVIRATGHPCIVVDPAIKAIKQGMRFCGQAFTLQYMPRRRGDVDVGSQFRGSPMPYGVPVLATSGITNQMYWGENMTNVTRKSGAIARVCDGYTRDSTAYIESNFPVFCRGVASGAVKGVEIPMVAIAKDVSVVCGGVRCEPRDIVMGDDDGVIIVPRDVAEKSVPHVGWFLKFEEEEWGPACADVDWPEIRRLAKEKKEYFDTIKDL
jgi:regulator of RNase E activity RraA